MSGLKILQVINVRWYNAEADYCLKLSKSLAAQGADVTVMGIKDSPAIKKAEEYGLKTATHIDLNSQNPISAISNYFALKELLLHEKYSVVNFHRSEGFIIGALACRATGIKVVRTRGDMRPVRTGFFNKILYNDLTDFIIASGEVIKKSIVERLGTRDDRVKTIYTAVDTGFFSPQKRSGKIKSELGIPQDSKLVTILGRLGEVKGHDHFIKAAAIVKEKCDNLRFLIIGRDVKDGGAALKALVKEHGLENDVHFILEERADIDELAASTDIGVITSTGSEANCRVAIEWMSSGVPVVSFATGVIPEVVIDGVTGYVVPNGDDKALADGIVTILDDDAKREMFADNARNNAANRYSLEKFAEKTMEIYKVLVD